MWVSDNTKIANWNCIFVKIELPERETDSCSTTLEKIIVTFFNIFCPNWNCWQNWRGKLFQLIRNTLSLRCCEANYNHSSRSRFVFWYNFESFGRVFRRETAEDLIRHTNNLIPRWLFFVCWLFKWNCSPLRKREYYVQLDYRGSNYSVE